MIKYLFDLTERLKMLISGITKNSALWANQTETPEKIQLQIDKLNAMEKTLEDLRNEAHEKQLEARALADEIETYADSIESIAVGLEKANSDKLAAYGIKQEKQLQQSQSQPHFSTHPWKMIPME